jgi:hypothetical protein
MRSLIRENRGSKAAVLPPPDRGRRAGREASPPRILPNSIVFRPYNLDRKERTVLEENVKKLLEASERVDKLGVRL